MDIGESNDFKRGYKSEFEYAQKVLKENEMLRTLLLEAIGYDDEWITTAAGYKKFNKNELIEIILKQRALMRRIYNADAPEKEIIKKEIEKFFWPVMHKDN